MSESKVPVVFYIGIMENVNYRDYRGSVGGYLGIIG